MVNRVVGSLMRILEVTLGVALIAIVLLNFANVVGRYVFNHSLLGAEEVQVYTMIWIAFLGAGIVTWRNMHLRMDAIAINFPQPVKTALRWIEAALAIAVVGYAITQSSWFYVNRIFAFGSKSDVAHIPMWIPHSAVLIGLGLVIIMLILRAAGFGAPPIEDPESAALEQRQ
ncbi:TRAP transporter small permease [Methylocella sp. CPCC 101449]|uniref:TRAP transporter small permease n=1 Tax=Methylocella sp. CPCC 101449 TaxID=2987531 RepID=UPI0028903F86|nr:TRAP transporter small permease [Methylocella sp. CPCC 101449]MDT2024092.1 TRAP transporter small permease [Methylocella sp. CPCC 101449]HEV2570579.1 TRAP transporter small permease [Beijerinckiaceae bacterium]